MWWKKDVGGHYMFLILNFSLYNRGQIICGSGGESFWSFAQSWRACFLLRRLQPPQHPKLLHVISSESEENRPNATTVSSRTTETHSRRASTRNMNKVWLRRARIIKTSGWWQSTGGHQTTNHCASASKPETWLSVRTRPCDAFFVVRFVFKRNAYERLGRRLFCQRTREIRQNHNLKNTVCNKRKNVVNYWKYYHTWTVLFIRLILTVVVAIAALTFRNAAANIAGEFTNSTC